MTTTIVVVVIMALVGVALVASQLSRLRRWLDRPPPLLDSPDDEEP